MARAAAPQTLSRLFRLCLLLVVVWALGSCAPSSQRSGIAAGSASAVANLREDVKLLETINSLQLSPSQVEVLLPLAAHLRSIAAQYDQRKQTVVGQMGPVLLEKRQALVRGQSAVVSVDRELSKLETKIAEVKAELHTEQEPYVRELRRALSRQQIYTLVGQQGGETKAQELLEWLREMPASDYADEAITCAEVMASPQLDLDAGTLQRIFQTARSLSAEEYGSAQLRLTGQIAPLFGATEQAESKAIRATFAHRRMTSLLREKAAVVSK